MRTSARLRSEHALASPTPGRCVAFLRAARREFASREVSIQLVRLLAVGARQCNAAAGGDIEGWPACAEDIVMLNGVPDDDLSVDGA